MRAQNVTDYERYVAVVPLDWTEWRRCAACGAEIGEPCRARSGKVVGGHPDMARTDLVFPHKNRWPRVRGGRPMPLIRVQDSAQQAADAVGATTQPAQP